MVDLRFSDIRILVDGFDVAPWLDAETIIELSRSLATKDQPSIWAVSFKLTKSFDDPAHPDSFDYRITDRYKPGKPVAIELYWEGQWRSPPFAASTLIKFSKPRNKGTYEELEIETHDEIGQRIELDSISDPERQYDAQGNAVDQTRDVLGVVRSLGDIAKSAYYVKDLTLVVPSDYLTQTTNASKEYWKDTSDSLFGATSQTIACNPDRALELNYVGKIGNDITIFSTPLDLSVVTPAKKLFDCTWGPYTTNPLVYEPVDEVEQLAEYVEVKGVASKAIARETVTRNSGRPPLSAAFSFNTPVNPITWVDTKTTINWAGLTIEIEAETRSTAQALSVAGGASAGFGEVTVQKDVTTKFFDTLKRHDREELKRYVPDALKLGTGTSSSIGTPAYQKETLYNLSFDDRVIGTIVNETGANAITGTSGNPADLGPIATSARNHSSLGQGVKISSGGMVSSPSLAQGAIPYFPGSYGGNDDRANAPQCEYFPDRYYEEKTPLRRKVQITWGATTLTKRVKPIDVGSALLTGDKFDLLAASLARLHTAQHAAHTCEFPLTTELFTSWQTPGKVVSVLEVAKGKRFHYFTGADSIEISANEIRCKTNLYWIGTTTEATGAAVPGPVAVVETFYILDEDGDILTDENDVPLELNNG